MTTFAGSLPWYPRPAKRGPLSLLASALGRALSPRLEAVEASEPERLRRRDPHTWRLVFEREMPAIYRYAAARLGAGPEAEDATSQVFAEAWEHASSFEDRGLPARAWFFGIARNVVNTHRRRWLQRPPALELVESDLSGVDPALGSDRLDLVRAIGELEGAWAEVITLRFVHGLSLQETADVMRLSVDAVKGKQARALAELRRRLDLVE